MPLLLYLAVVLPFRLTFENEAKIFTFVYWFEFMIDMIFIVDIPLNFRTGIFVPKPPASNVVSALPKETEDGGDDDAEVEMHTDLVEYDRFRVAMNYVKTWFVLDVVSGVPFAAIELIATGGKGSEGSDPLGAIKSLKLIRFLKLGRLLKMEKILSSLDRDVLDTIEDFFAAGSTRSVMMMLKLVLTMAYINHILACGWVAIGRLTSSQGMDENWLFYEQRGPFTAEDCTGVNGDRDAYTIYIAAFYYCLTTMTSVGYGDIITRNTLERLYCIGLEFCGAIVFATIIANITAVVTSMDMNARMVVEQLDAVASFVVTRAFPEKMGKKIRRHFRHFYAHQSAIDETKIFSELSTVLRAEVSEYLMTELIGAESFFITMPKIMWPRILPCLRPMSFERGEVVCCQGEECTDIYLVRSSPHGHTEAQHT